MRANFIGMYDSDGNLKKEKSINMMKFIENLEEGFATAQR